MTHGLCPLATFVAPICLRKSKCIVTPALFCTLVYLKKQSTKLYQRMDTLMSDALHTTITILTKLIVFFSANYLVYILPIVGVIVLLIAIIFVTIFALGIRKRREKKIRR